MRARIIALSLVVSSGSALADTPTLDATLTWIRDKLRDRGKVEVDIGTGKFSSKVIIEQGLTWGGDQCVIHYKRSVTRINDLGQRSASEGTSRVPLAEMNPGSAKTYVDLCPPQTEGVSAKCHHVELFGRGGRDVVKYDGIGGPSRSSRLPIVLRDSEGELASKLRDALKHAANLCAAKEPDFPK